MKSGLLKPPTSRAVRVGRGTDIDERESGGKSATDSIIGPDDLARVWSEPKLQNGQVTNWNCVRWR